MSALLRSLSRDARLLFLTRSVRLFGYGLVSVILVLYLAALGMSGAEIGLLLTLTLVGDTLISLWLTTHADRLGRRRVLIVGAVLMLLAGLAFASGAAFWVLLVAAIAGVISPSGNEVGPFLAVEQASLSELVGPQERTGVFAWYNLAGSVATALGALAGGVGARAFQLAGVSTLDSYRAVLLGYAALGLVLALVFVGLTAATEARPLEKAASASVASRFGLHQSRSRVLELASLFALDAFAGGFVIQSILAYWFATRFGAPADTLGLIFFGANLLAGLSSLAAARLAARFGLLQTMVFTHLPSNVLLLLVPLMPVLPLAVAVLLARFAISQMDVPTRQAYTMALVAPDERSAAAGITGVARTLGAAVSSGLAAPLVASAALASLPFFLAGGLKIAYDLLVYFRFRHVPLPPEPARG
jgi:MFS family permease